MAVKALQLVLLAATGESLSIQRVAELPMVAPALQPVPKAALAPKQQCAALFRLLQAPPGGEWVNYDTFFQSTNGATQTSNITGQGRQTIQIEAKGLPCAASIDASGCTSAPITLHARSGTSDLSVLGQIMNWPSAEFNFLTDKWLAEVAPEMASTGGPTKVLDAGGNIGLAAVTLALMYPKATVVSIEPEPGNFAVLKLNAAAVSNIKPINTGIWGHDASLQVVQGSRVASGRVSVKEWDFEVKEVAADTPGAIKALGLPSILQQAGLDSFDFVKMDVEGSEKEVFESAHLAQWLPNVKVLLTELHPDKTPGFETTFKGIMGTNQFQEVTPAGVPEYVCYTRGRA